MQREKLPLVSQLFLISGATALVYQVAWVRELTLILGASYQATSITLAAFMAGLAWGGFCFGRWAEKVDRPLRVYGWIEIAVAAFALALPLLLRQIDALYVSVALGVEADAAVLAAMRFALAFAVLFLPTFFMGGTLPVLVRFAVRQQGDLARRLGWLYGINTLGAAAGAIAAGFFLLPALGVWHTQLCAVASNAAIGVIALIASRRTSSDPHARRHEPPHAAPEAHDTDLREPGPGDLWPLRLAFWGTGVSGLCALAFEVMWARAITIAVGNTTYSFTVMLTAFLVGIWLGSWLHAALPIKRIRESTQFGVVLAAIGASGFAVSVLIPRLPGIAIRLNLYLFDDLQRVHHGTTLLVAFLVMLVPCIFMGIAFPLSGQARARLRSGFGRSAGDTLAVNTLGAIAGSLLAGFALIPGLGLQRGMLLVAAVDLAFGVVVLTAVMLARTPARKPLIVGMSIALIGVILILPGFVHPWDRKQLGAFENNQLRRYVDDEGQLDIAGAMKDGELRYFEEGKTATVSVMERAGQRALLVNGKTVATDTPSALPHELMLGHVPVLVHPHPRSALVVGLGAGITLGAVQSHPQIDTVVLVEIEEAVLGAAALFSHINNSALEDPRLEIVIQDGRNFLKTTRRSFDLITADPIHPWAAGAGYLYTTEYYRLAAQHLNPGGVMCQWLPGYELTQENFRSVVASFAEAFPFATLWQTPRDAILIGSSAPTELDLASIGERIREPSVQHQLSLLGLDDPVSFVSELALDDAAFRRLASGAPINTDDNLYLEFSSPLSIGWAEGLDNATLIDRYRTGPRELIRNAATLFESDDAAAEELQALQRAKSATVRAQLLVTMGESSLAAINQSLRSVLQSFPDYGVARVALGANLARLARSALLAGRPAEAVRGAQRAVALNPTNAEAHHILGAALVELGQPRRGIPHLEEAIRLLPHHSVPYGVLALALANAGQLAEADRVLSAGLELKPDSEAMLDLRAKLRAEQRPR